jgi:hypothetical protein
MAESRITLRDFEPYASVPLQSVLRRPGAPVVKSRKLLGFRVFQTLGLDPAHQGTAYILRNQPVDDKWNGVKRWKHMDS